MTPSCWLVSSATVFAIASMTSSASAVSTLSDRRLQDIRQRNRRSVRPSCNGGRGALALLASLTLNFSILLPRPLSPERYTNLFRLPCAKCVTWTRYYAMTRHRKALILLALRRMMAEKPKSGYYRAKKPANALASRAFGLVAGTGFEPVTFRL